ncbi:response regulator transcription factor [Collimonas sp.]|uniref:response regulator transcription factor n=1 Tax=Collimonas sp. TaxID=1963772 RepID=UPI002B84C472|nr:response regulator transcription factor [Collimonas sp.]HWW08359.1 response regulator transcription factor [Collimonas sp.]
MSLIGLADDHPVILDALESTLGKERSIRIGFKARSAAQLFDLLATQPCEILVTDYSMKQGEPGSDGLAMIERLLRLYPQIKLVVFTMLANPALLQGLHKLNLQGIVSKNDEMGEVLHAVQHIEAGRQQCYLSPSISSGLAHGLQAAGFDKQAPALSKRELEVVRLFAQGNNLNDISQNLGRAVTTVATHKHNAMQKLGVTSNADLIRYAYETGIA